MLTNWIYLRFNRTPVMGHTGENLARRPIAQRLMRPLVIVEAQPAADAPARLGHRAIRLDEGEWRGASQPRALSEPDVNLSIHPAPIIQPLVPGSSGRTWSGLRRLSERNQSHAANVCPRNRLYLRDTHRTMKASIVRSSSRSFEG